MVESTAKDKPPVGSVGNMYRRRLKSSLYPALSISDPAWPHHPLYQPTLPHTLGLCDLCPSLEKQLLVFPGHKCGSLQLVVSCPVGRDG